MLHTILHKILGHQTPINQQIDCFESETPVMFQAGYSGVPASQRPGVPAWHCHVTSLFLAEETALDLMTEWQSN